MKLFLKYRQAHNGYVLIKGKLLKKIMLQFANDINVGSKTTQLEIFNFRVFLDHSNYGIKKIDH